MRCSFCGRTTNAIGPLISGPSVSICAECVRELLAVLVKVETPVVRLASLDRRPCAFCGQADGPSTVRLQGRHALMCAACVSLGASILLEPDADSGDRPMSPATRAELEKLWLALLRANPDLAVRDAELE